MSARSPYETYEVQGGVVTRYRQGETVHAKYTLHPDSAGVKWGPMGSYRLRRGENDDVVYWINRKSTWVWLRRAPRASGPATTLEMQLARAYWWASGGCKLPKAPPPIWPHAVLADDVVQDLTRGGAAERRSLSESLESARLSCPTSVDECREIFMSSWTARRCVRCATPQSSCERRSAARVPCLLDSRSAQRRNGSK